MFKRGISLIITLLIILTIPSYSLLSVGAAGAEENTDNVSGETDNDADVGTEYPTITEIKNETNGVRITWDEFGAYSRYRVYYQKAASDSAVWNEKYDINSWDAVAVVEGGSYLHTAVDDSELGVYTVCAVNDLGEDASAFNADGWENRFYAAPEINSISIDEDGVHLTWDRDGADSGIYYRILRRPADEDEFAVIASGIDDIAYTDRTFTPGNNYVYTLCLTDGHDHVLSGCTEGVSTLSVYTEITSVENTANGAKISWLPFIGAVKYRIYYRNSGTWVRLTEVAGTSYTDTQIRDGETRFYTVRCIGQNGAFISGYNKDGWSNTYFAPPVIRKISYSNQQYTVSWSAYSAISGYRIFRRGFGDTELTQAGDKIGYSFTDNSVPAGAIVSYTLRAVDENGAFVSDFSEESVWYQNGSPANVTFTKDGKNFRLIDGAAANGYFRENGKNYYYKNGYRVEHNWYHSGHYRTKYNRTQWLYELMKDTGETPSCNISSCKTVFEIAKKRGIISSYGTADFTASVDRLFAAQTMVRAIGYQNRKVGTVSDSSDTSLSTVAYYGYFIPDNNNKLYPKALVTADEFDKIISELKLRQKLKGKKLTVFGDSIMYGYGNPVGTTFEGIAEMVGGKYGMQIKKYAKSGSVMGKTSGKSHIADQIRNAIDAGRKSDLIIINGGTNDTWHTDIKLGQITQGYDMSSIDESSFSGGFEKALWLIKNEWKNAPVIYLRSHKMALGTKSRQESIGERALELCQKWKVAGIDYYNESELDGNILSMSRRYCWDDDDDDRGIHPNALGYAKYYLPPIGENIASLFDLSFVGDCNGDGEIDIIDVFYMQEYLATAPTDVDDLTMMGGDVDGSGTLNIVDATYIQRGLAGLDISPYAIGETL